MNKDLTVGNERKVLFSYTLPLLGSMLFQQLYNIADSLVAGRFISSNALAAVGNSYELTLIFLAFASGLNMGVTVIVSQYFGAKDYKNMKTSITTTYIFTLILTFLLTALSLVFMDGMLTLIRTPKEVFAESKLYIDIYAYGLIFMFIYNISTAIFSAMGDSRTPFIFLALSSTGNILVDILFVAKFNMGVAGVAWATFLCQGISAVLAFSALMLRLRKVTSGIKAEIFSSDILKKIIYIAGPSTIQQGSVSIGNIIIQSVINGFGPVVMAGYAASIKLNNLVITSIGTISNGVSSFSAQNIGARKIDRVLKGRKEGIILTLFFTLTVSVLYFFGGSLIMRLFVLKEETAVIESGMEFLKIASPFYSVIMIKMITDGVLRGSGDMVPFMISTLADLFLRVALSIVFSLLLQRSLGIWLGWPVGWSIGTLISLYFYKKGNWQKKRLIA